MRRLRMRLIFHTLVCNLLHRTYALSTILPFTRSRPQADVTTCLTNDEPMHAAVAVATLGRPSARSAAFMASLIASIHLLSASPLEVQALRRAACEQERLRPATPAPWVASHSRLPRIPYYDRARLSKRLQLEYVFCPASGLCMTKQLPWFVVKMRSPSSA